MAQVGDPVAPFMDEFVHIRDAMSLSQKRIDYARQALKHESDAGLDVVGFGSLARREMTGESDFDYLVLVRDLPQDPNAPIRLLSAADGLRRQWLAEEGHSDQEVTGPGSSGVFGHAVGAFDLLEQIGLQSDTNHSMTRRMLLLEESISLMNPVVHEEVQRATLRRYLDADQTRPEKVPRFLLNDVVRYWRTISVDYQAKAREGQYISGLRYLKLIITRKTLFAGTLMSLLLCGRDGCHTATASDLAAEFSLTPLQRLVRRHDAAPLEVQDAMREVLRTVDLFLARSADREWRASVRGSRKGGQSTGAFDEMRAAADRLQDALETIFFRWDLVRGRAHRLLVF